MRCALKLLTVTADIFPLGVCLKHVDEGHAGIGINIAGPTEAPILILSSNPETPRTQQAPTARQLMAKCSQQMIANCMTPIWPRPAHQQDFLMNAPMQGKVKATLRAKIARGLKSGFQSVIMFRVYRRKPKPVAAPGYSILDQMPDEPARKSGIFAGAIGATLVAFIGVFAASCVSIYSTVIVKQGGAVITALLGDFWLPNKWQLMLTLVLLVVAMVVVYLREKALGDAVKAQAQDFKDQMSTLPPQNFLDVYGTAIKEVGEVRRNTKVLFREKKLEADALTQSIRSVLKVVLGLAKLWDGVASGRETMVYRANIMIVIHPDAMEGMKDPNGPFAQIITDSPFFLYRDNLASRIDYSTGLLIIENSDFTASSNVDQSGPDDRVRPLCLPFSTKATECQPNLFGAPEGLVNKSAAYVGNTTKEMKKWLDGLSTADPRYHQEYARGIRNYYESRREAQSILAMPIEFEGEVIAMLNIYRNKDDIFKGEERARQFVSLMRPICYQLSKMLKLVSDLD